MLLGSTYVPIYTCFFKSDDDFSSSGRRRFNEGARGLLSENFRSQMTAQGALRAMICKVVVC